MHVHVTPNLENGPGINQVRYLGRAGIIRSDLLYQKIKLLGPSNPKSENVSLCSAQKMVGIKDTRRPKG